MSGEGTGSDFSQLFDKRGVIEGAHGGHVVEATLAVQGEELRRARGTEGTLDAVGPLWRQRSSAHSTLKSLLGIRTESHEAVVIGAVGSMEENASLEVLAILTDLTAGDEVTPLVAYCRAVGVATGCPALQTYFLAAGECLEECVILCWILERVSE